ncbi:hypothetical protein EJ06DRAFT_502573 [Trichodelitschia bisporula]|uniref:T6SS Phospholipase effector Tle1-like catalytic domain-containing protein n=1 Tax=Trichodelitschia bisporula TaxID=703511 RepID=A0A6G1IAQ7_9PEZI|nr:hypothetical protein EJ06DRAFT_502573 [Trichodelitschia bisporula]
MEAFHVSDAQTSNVEDFASENRPRKSFVLCFDGTGNEFSGTDSDSNILKIFRMLDRSEESQFHYYQPGIGTYVECSSLSHTGKIEQLKLWYKKAKDSAIGTSFDHHVMGGYKFLMRYYNVGDDIYLFGFSRGAYTARFLAEMLDHVGLLSAGNEEMARFAWKAFQKWQCRTERTEKERAQKKYLLNFMFAFRETFSRPVRRIRFLGLFDTVNSVPKFENAWMQRSKFPYTARSSAKVIRHAVSIDERRAKFRQDLISEVKRHDPTKEGHHHENSGLASEKKTEKESQPPRGRKLAVPSAFRDAAETVGIRSLSPNLSLCDEDCASSIASHDSMAAVQRAKRSNTHIYGDDPPSEEQDILEVWFAGCHADIGGGWTLDVARGERIALSHVPLVWMVREAMHAGLKFDPVKLRALNCAPEDQDPNIFSADVADAVAFREQARVPTINIDPGSPEPEKGARGLDGTVEPQTPQPQGQTMRSRFHDALHTAAMTGRIHDMLKFRNGSPVPSVIAWNIMEYLPFRRMDLQEDGSWESITWPLPKGEVRDVPLNVLVHGSVIRRMQADEKYRPGNLIVGGGGRGVRKAPPHLGTGKWKIVREEGDPVGELWVRDCEGDEKAANGANGTSKAKKKKDKKHKM